MALAGVAHWAHTVHGPGPLSIHLDFPGMDLLQLTIVLSVYGIAQLCTFWEMEKKC